MVGPFKHVITTEEELRGVIGTTLDIAEQKVIPIIDEHCRRVIDASPFLLISSADADGNMDVSPKGDPAGFVKVLDEKHIAIPDRPGNRRADTMLNIMQNPHVGILFLVPKLGETLRVNGRAQVVADDELLEQLTLKGKKPQFAIVVTVDEAFLHCSRCITGSNLWQPETWDGLEMASLRDIIRDHSRLHFEAKQQT